GPAGGADAARDVRLDGHERSPLHVMHLGSDRLDRPGHLVTERHRHPGHAALRPLVPVEDVEVGPADRSGVHAHEHLPLARIGDGNVLELGAGTRCGLTQGAHRAQPSASGSTRAAGPTTGGGTIGSGAASKPDPTAQSRGPDPTTEGAIMRVGRIGVAIAAVAALASACGGLGSDDPGSGGATGASGTTGIEHPTGASDLILRVAYEGGFVAYEYTLGTTPFWSLFGDGTLIVPGPQIEIYPGPALPNLTATPVSEDGIQAILQAARDAGLMDGDQNYGDMCIADAANTVFTTT